MMLTWLLVLLVLLSEAAAEPADKYDDQAHMKERNLKLSCSSSIHNGKGKTDHAVGLTVQQQKDPRIFMKYSHLSPYSHYAQGLDKVLGKSPEPAKRLNATLIVFTTMGGHVDVIITESGFVPPYGAHECDRNNFGPGLLPPRKKDTAVGKPVVGGYKDLKPAGFGSYFPGSHHPAGKEEFPEDMHKGPGSGVIFMGNIPEWTPLVSQLDSLGHFKHLSDVAGRSVIVCTETVKGLHGEAKCVGQILACCTLGFSSMIRPIHVKH